MTTETRYKGTSILPTSGGWDGLYDLDGIPLDEQFALYEAARDLYDAAVCLRRVARDLRANRELRAAMDIEVIIREREAELALIIPPLGPGPAQARA